MVPLEDKLKEKLVEAIEKNFKVNLKGKIDRYIQILKTRKEFKGDITIILYNLRRFSRRSSEQTGKIIGEYLKNTMPQIHSYQVVKGFLNILLTDGFWLEILNKIYNIKNYGIKQIKDGSEQVMVEYSSPNTNKPLHLGHIRNNLLGDSISRILQGYGKRVIKVNLVNDRGIHICKTMLAWKKWGGGETPESSGIKGDHFVGKYYVIFENEYKRQIQELVDSGISQEEARMKASIIQEAQELLRKWENNDKETIELWKTMNNWVYQGFEQTYKDLGVKFDKIYYESQTYKLGKSLIQKAIKYKKLIVKDDGSVWIDLKKHLLEEKLLLRADGTSVYITQDIGTAYQRFKEYDLSKLIYVVGNEQEHHFKTLVAILKELGYSWADKIHHLSYGMINLPEGRMKSREGTVVDADDLIKEMLARSRKISRDLGKISSFSKDYQEKICRIIALGALKYFILKVSPVKNMVFKPEESIDFNGNTGPFIQYTYARIQSVLKNAKENNIIYSLPVNTRIELENKERELIKLLYSFPLIVSVAAENYSPAVVANYVYELSKEYNQFYQDYPILKSGSQIRNFRIILSDFTARIIKVAMDLLGIDVPERM